MRAPPILPLTAIALTGALALSALRNIDALPQLFNKLQAQAEGIPASSKSTPAPPKPASALPGQPPTPLQVASADPQKVAQTSTPQACTTSPAQLAKDAGLSPGELQALQNLSSRRGQLDDREKALDTQLQLLAAADVKVDGKLKALAALKGEIQGLLGLSENKSQAEIDRLVIVYSKMKPKDAAAIITSLDDKVRVPVAAKMKETTLAAILAQMPTADAKKLTELLANRFNAVKKVAETINNPPPEPPPPAEAPPKPAKKPARARKAG